MAPLQTRALVAAVVDVDVSGRHRLILIRFRPRWLDHIVNTVFLHRVLGVAALFPPSPLPEDMFTAALKLACCSAMVSCVRGVLLVC